MKNEKARGKCDGEKKKKSKGEITRFLLASRNLRSDRKSKSTILSKSILICFFNPNKPKTICNKIKILWKIPTPSSLQNSSLLALSKKFHIYLEIQYTAVLDLGPRCGILKFWESLMVYGWIWLDFMTVW